MVLLPNIFETFRRPKPSKPCQLLQLQGFGLDRKLGNKYEGETTTHLLTFFGGS
jgi:hypothetical protein